MGAVEAFVGTRTDPCDRPDPLDRADRIRFVAQFGLPIVAGLVSWLIPQALSPDGLDGAMADFGIYVDGARAALHGGELYRDGPNAFVYPPIAAIGFMLFLLGPTVGWKILWAVAGWVGIIAVVRRCGLRGWSASLVAATAIATAEPVTLSTSLGQIEILLTCLILLDILPGEAGASRRGGTAERRRLPVGWLVGLMTAIKLTPGLFIVYLLVARRRRAALTALITAAVLTAIGWVGLPGYSAFYWHRLVTTRSVGFESDPIYLDNQSFTGAAMRAFGLAAGPTIGTVVSVVVVVLGLTVALVLRRRGQEALGVVLVGLTSALASPVSWTHHFVWIVPLAVLLILPGRDDPGPTPSRWVVGVGSLLVLWVWVAPYQILPAGGMKELDYSPAQLLLSVTTPLLGVALLAAVLVTELAGRRGVAGPGREDA